MEGNDICAVRSLWESFVENFIRSTVQVFWFHIIAMDMLCGLMISKSAYLSSFVYTAFISNRHLLMHTRIRYKCVFSVIQNTVNSKAKLFTTTVIEKLRRRRGEDEDVLEVTSILLYPFRRLLAEYQAEWHALSNLHYKYYQNNTTTGAGRTLSGSFRSTGSTRGSTGLDTSSVSSGSSDSSGASSASSATTAVGILVVVLVGVLVIFIMVVAD
ncbi:unnamed protein product [Ceratitis capitata]|uniref:(Mediterranean fruit fly) hypothetical protein n=1 Tax=Ceratitis capitata TaxID=7213 RepID=A0A811V532_CERCA|nr:unnamed protein product [Ceratitis capitata]